jgi:hypothetical protein
VSLSDSLSSFISGAGRPFSNSLHSRTNPFGRSPPRPRASAISAVSLMQCTLASVPSSIMIARPLPSSSPCTSTLLSSLVLRRRSDSFRYSHALQGLQPFDGVPVFRLHPSPADHKVRRLSAYPGGRGVNCVYSEEKIVAKRGSVEVKATGEQRQTRNARSASSLTVVESFFRLRPVKKLLEVWRPLGLRPRSQSSPAWLRHGLHTRSQ